MLSKKNLLFWSDLLSIVAINVIMLLKLDLAFGFTWIGVLFSSLLSWLIIAYFQNLYRWRDRILFNEDINRLLVGIIAFTGLWLILLRFLVTEVVLLDIMLFIPFLILVLLIGRYLFRMYWQSLLRQEKYALVGLDIEGIEQIYALLNENSSLLGQCIGYFGANSRSEINYLGGIDNMSSIDLSSFGTIICDESSLDFEQIRDLVNICDRNFIDLEVVPRSAKIFPRNIHVSYIESIPTFSLLQPRLFRLSNRILKRLFDLLIAIPVVLILLPVMVLILGAIIKYESKGPIFFRQKRSGYLGKPFKCIKFRSMSLNLSADQVQAKKLDSRITKIGALMRKTSLDEFPQFVNVLLGDMSIVGPRPHMLAHTDQYTELLDDYMIRHSVKPGITGLAQVKGWRGPTDELYKMRRRVEYDVRYIENWSISLDISCILKTISNVWSPDENAF